MSKATTPPRRPQPREPGSRATTHLGQDAPTAPTRTARTGRQETRQTQEPSRAKLTTVAVFPRYYSLDNLAVRRDGSILVTEALQQELWYISPADTRGPAEPILVHTFDQLASGLVETQPDVFLLSTSEGPAHESCLRRLDLRHWNPDEPVRAETVLEFGKPAEGLAGSCLLAPGVILLADSLAGHIWRVDLPPRHGNATARVWLQHDTMGCDPGSLLVPPQPGIKGVRYAARTGYLYYTSTAHRLLMRVPVGPGRHDPATTTAAPRARQPGHHAPRTRRANRPDPHGQSRPTRNHANAGTVTGEAHRGCRLSAVLLAGQSRCAT